MNRAIVALLLSLPFVSTIQAALVINGDLSGSEFTDNNSNILSPDMLDTGWQAKARWTVTGEALVHTVGDNWGVGQVNTVAGSDAGSQLSFGFDWTPVTGSSTAALELNYQLIGFVVGSVPAATSELFVGMNFNGAQVGNAGGAVTQAVDLLTGNTISFTASGGTRGNASQGSAIGVAGATSEMDLLFDLSDDASGITDVSAFDYVGFRFAINSNDDATAVGSMIDNVTLTAGPVPEPSRTVLLGFGLIALLLRRRR